MAIKSKISLKHDYTLVINEDGTLNLKARATDGEIYEFDGVNGNILDASDMEAYSYSESMELPLPELRIAAYKFLKDWNVDEQTTMAIIADLTPWFEQFAVEPHTKDAWEEVLEKRVAELKKKEELHRGEISRVVANFRKWVADADECEIYHDAEWKVKSISSIKETYKAVWHEYKKAEAELENYRETICRKGGHGNEK